MTMMMMMMYCMCLGSATCLYGVVCRFIPWQVCLLRVAFAWALVPGVEIPVGFMCASVLLQRGWGSVLGGQLCLAECVALCCRPCLHVFVLRVQHRSNGPLPWRCSMHCIVGVGLIPAQRLFGIRAGPSWRVPPFTSRHRWTGSAVTLRAWWVPALSGDGWRGRQ